MDALDLWDALGSAPSPTQGAALLLASGQARDVDEALDQPLAALAAYAVRELVSRCPHPTTPSIDTSVTCPNCHELLEVELDLAAVAATLVQDPLSQLIVGDVVVRAPTTRDVVAALSTANPAASLRRACVEAPGADLGDRVDPAIDEAAELLTGVAALAVSVTCPECSSLLSAAVDVVALLGEQVSEEAHRLLAEVAELAAVYGWAEQEILALSSGRRQAYLKLSRAWRDG